MNVGDFLALLDIESVEKLSSAIPGFLELVHF